LYSISPARRNSAGCRMVRRKYFTDCPFILPICI
jgi:hypothetical protein